MVAGSFPKQVCIAKIYPCRSKFGAHARRVFGAIEKIMFEKCFLGKHLDDVRNPKKKVKARQRIRNAEKDFRRKRFRDSLSH